MNGTLTDTNYEIKALRFARLCLQEFIPVDQYAILNKVMRKINKLYGSISVFIKDCQKKRQRNITDCAAIYELENIGTQLLNIYNVFLTNTQNKNLPATHVRLPDYARKAFPLLFSNSPHTAAQSRTALSKLHLSLDRLTNNIIFILDSVKNNSDQINLQKEATTAFLNKYVIERTAIHDISTLENFAKQLFTAFNVAQDSKMETDTENTTYNSSIMLGVLYYLTFVYLCDFEYYSRDFVHALFDSKLLSDMTFEQAMHEFKRTKLLVLTTLDWQLNKLSFTENLEVKFVPSPAC